MSSRAVQPISSWWYFLVLAVLAQRPNARGDFGVIGHERAGVADRSEVLAGVEAESCCAGSTPGHEAAAGCSVSLCGILHHHEIMRFSDRLESVEVGELAE